MGAGFMATPGEMNMSTETQGGMDRNQILLWVAIAIVVIGGLYYLV
jgi:hypothetical protein